MRKYRNKLSVAVFLIAIFAVITVSFTQEKSESEPLMDEEESESLEDAKKGGLVGYVKFLKEFPDSEWAPEVKIWVEIVKGNYDQYKEITFLTKHVAESLLKQRVYDLRLNKVTSLTKETAGVLAKWLGNEIYLNGLKTLEVDVARELSKWSGTENELHFDGLKKLSKKQILKFTLNK